MAESSAPTDADAVARREFLIAWYGVLWQNIDRSMTGMWQLLAPITVVGTALAAIHGDYLPIWVGGVVTILTAFWALNLTIDLNSWHRRNQYLLIGVEKEFFKEADWGHLIPQKYKKRTQVWIHFYRVHGIALTILVVAAVVDICILAFQRETDCGTWVALVLVLVGGLSYTAWHIHGDLKSAGKMRTELEGEVTGDSTGV